jgi:tRNA nucleotidyltransferase (CCA-adding enzyme)
MQMKSTKFDTVLQSSLKKLFKRYRLLKEIIDEFIACNGQVLLVGGAVRDLLLGLPLKDLDCQIHKLSMEQVEKILQKFGTVSYVGKSFGVLRLHGLEVDWSLPRADSIGRKPVVAIDPFMDIQESFRRRDVTINAIGIDLHTGQLIDPFEGVRDLQAGVLRATDEQRFGEDPLRLFRVMQFVGRFEFKPTDQLNRLCAQMDLQEISRERIEAEFEKLLLRSKRPSLGFRWLNSIGRLEEILPELAQTKGVPQSPQWHPEGDVFEHTMQAVDAASALSYDDEHQKIIVLLAALCHDLGKITATVNVEGSWKSIGHETAGIPLAKQLLNRLTSKKEIKAVVVKLVAHHMAPLQFVDSNASPAAYKRLALALSPQTNLATLAQLALADKRGRNGHGHEPLTASIPGIDTFLARARDAGVLFGKEEPILQGSDIIDSVQPGPRMGEILSKAYMIQIEKGITDKQELKKRAMQS